MTTGDSYHVYVLSLTWGSYFSPPSGFFFSTVVSYDTSNLVHTLGRSQQNHIKHLCSKGEVGGMPIGGPSRYLGQPHHYHYARVRQSACDFGAQVNQPGWASELNLDTALSLHLEGQYNPKQINSLIPRVKDRAGDPTRLGSKLSSGVPPAGNITNCMAGGLPPVLCYGNNWCTIPSNKELIIIIIPYFVVLVLLFVYGIWSINEN